MQKENNSVVVYITLNYIMQLGNVVAELQGWEKQEGLNDMMCSTWVYVWPVAMWHQPLYLCAVGTMSDVPSDCHSMTCSSFSSKHQLWSSANW